MSPRPSGCDFSFSADESPFFPRIPPLPLLGGAERERRQTPGAGKNFPWKRARAIPAKNPKLLAAQCFPTTPTPTPTPARKCISRIIEQSNETSPRVAFFSRDSNGIYFRAWKEGIRVEKKGRREEKKGKKKKKNWIRWGGGKNEMAKDLVRSHPNSAHVRAAACRNQGWRRWKGVDGTARRGMVPQGCVPESG